MKNLRLAQIANFHYRYLAKMCPLQPETWENYVYNIKMTPGNAQRKYMSLREFSVSRWKVSLQAQV